MKESKTKVSKTADILRKGIPVFFWAAVILLCFLYRDRITVENIVNFTPENPVLAVGIMLLLFAFKSVTFVIYGSILYAVNGILFPLPFAILLNMAGSAIMATLPFLIGRRKGSGLLVKLTEKYPKLSVLRKLPSENGFFLSMVIRLMGCLPGDVVSMYFGASGIRYEIEDRELQIVLRGPLEQLSGIRPSDVYALVDLSGYSSDSSAKVTKTPTIVIDAENAADVYEVGEYAVQVQIN